MPRRRATVGSPHPEAEDVPPRTVLNFFLGERGGYPSPRFLVIIIV